MSIYVRGAARRGQWLASLSFLVLGCATGALATTKLSVQISPSVASPAPVGQAVMWTVTTGHTTGRVTYRFLAGQAGSKLSVVRDFSPVNTLPWSALTEGTYHVLAQVRDTSGQVGQGGAIYTLKSRIIGTTPVVSATQNPLVALYSAPPCAAGSTVQVTFWPAAGNAENPMSTSPETCNGTNSVNFYVAGMLPTTLYNLQQTTTTNGKSETGPLTTFLTGAVNYPMPDYKVVTPATKKTDTTDGLLLISYKAVKATPPLYPSPTATDLNGNVLWYYWDPESPSAPQSEYLTRPVAGGTFLIQMWGGALREVDLAGNIVHETNVLRIAQQLREQGKDTPDWLSHEALRLPNGHTVTLGSAERLLNVQCGGNGGNEPCPVDVVGDMIIDLDQNFQVAWSWSSFDFLNTSRTAVLNEKCGVGGTSGVDKCGHLRLASTANDWTHANSLFYTSDGNLVISIRNQDYILKVNYQNGTGNGQIIWTLGREGGCSTTPACTGPAFSIQTPTKFFQDQWPWFSHQHDIEFDGTNYEVYDNGNTRVSPLPLGLGKGNSRGYVFSVDETNMVVTVLLGVDLNSFSPGFGSAQLLSNGDYQFTNGTINDGLNSQVIESMPKGVFNFEGAWKTRTYRSFRMTDLYTYTE